VYGIINDNGTGFELTGPESHRDELLAKLFKIYATNPEVIFRRMTYFDRQAEKVKR
jgi:hypothetical protein